MFKTVRMARLDALVPRRSLRAVLEGLGSAGLAELLPAGGKPPEDGASEAAALSKRLAALNAALGVRPVPAPAGAAGGLAAARSAIGMWEPRAEGALKRRRELAAEAARLSAEAARLRPYGGLGLPASTGAGSLLFSAAGEVPEEELARLLERLPESCAAAVLGPSGGGVRLAAVAGPTARLRLEKTLNEAGFRPEGITAEPGVSLADLYAAAELRAAAASAALEKEEAALAAMAAEAAGPLAGAGAVLDRETALTEAEASAGGTEGAALLSAWVPAAGSPLAARIAGERAGGVCAAEIRPPLPGEDVPVLLAARRALRPFGLLVSSYGLPRYAEIEPTPFAAAVFLLMFGMMFGDVGHGAAVSAAGLWLSRRGAGRARDAGRVMFWGGVSAALFGLLYGSFFGLERFRRFALWRDPLQGDPLSLVLAAAAFGAVVISLGTALNALNRFRVGDVYGALLGRFGAAGLLFYWSALLLAAGFLGAAPASALMCCAAACWVVSGALGARGEGALAAAAEAAVGAFEGALLYLANTVSFVRLAAYAMSHAALLSAAYALRDAADGAWGANSAAGLAAAVLGNAAAVGLEGLVACVQALRLEYYEFFGKFLEGEGRPFRPFTLEKERGKDENLV